MIKKQHYSGFFETHLESLLKELGARTLVTVGFDSQICLRGTVTDALYRNYRVIALRDCIGTGEFPETEEGRWSNFLAVRDIETTIGYTATAEDLSPPASAYPDSQMRHRRPTSPGFDTSRGRPRWRRAPHLS